MLFDRGKLFESIMRYSYHHTSSAHFSSGTLNFGLIVLNVLILMHKFNAHFYKKILDLEYGLELLFANLNVSLIDMVPSNSVMGSLNYGGGLYSCQDFAGWVFDRGRFYRDTLTSCMLVFKISKLRVAYNENSLYELTLAYGNCSELLWEYSNVFVFVKNGDSHDARKLSDKMLPQVIFPWTDEVLLVTRENKLENTRELFEQLLVRDFRLPTHMEEDWKEFIEQEIISVNNTMLLAWKLNFLQLNPRVCLPEIELFIFFLPGEYVKKMHGSVVQSLSEDADSLLWRLSSGLLVLSFSMLVQRRPVFRQEQKETYRRFLWGV
ncbi:hypothetical protein MKW98_022925 [Papaver atlanticum]|uniref:Uncharacterized protein n=1 Tax=Papaver atlanticum TaxID=357466 RepID=A0AAD4TJE2_9MAGN|nr:hypothetical protein MKW98_022925 [Papaver atlanticum]